MERRNYWRECLECAFDEHGIVATDEQIDAIARDVEDAHENIGQAFHVPSDTSSEQVELNKLRIALREEREKVMCRNCRGVGRIFSQGPYHGSDTECHVCRGEGRHKP